MEKNEENLCFKCHPDIRGLCCFFTTEIAGYNLILTRHPCKFLDLNSRTCKVYSKRHEMNLNCLTIEEMIIDGAIPKECLYVANNIEYKKRKDIRILNLPFNLSDKNKLEYYKENNVPHYQIAVYDIKRSFICPECKSGDLSEVFLENSIGEERSEFYFTYKCNKCKNRWENPRKIKKEGYFREE